MRVPREVRQARGGAPADIEAARGAQGELGEDEAGRADLDPITGTGRVRVAGAGGIAPGVGADGGVPAVADAEVLNEEGQQGIGNALGYVTAAKAILMTIARLSAVMSLNPNPIVQIAKNLTNKGLSEQAIAFLEAALVDSAIKGTQTNQQIVLLKAMANTIHGEAETNIAFWKEVINENKQLGKQTQDLAKMA